MYDDDWRSRDRQERFRARLDLSIVDRLRQDALEIRARSAAFHTSERTAAGRQAQRRRAHRLEQIDRTIDYLTKDPRGQAWTPPEPRPPRPPKKPRFSF